MRLDEKARENLEAAERLLDRSDDGRVEPLSNAATARAYYAAYQAVADRAQQEGLSFDSRGAQYYRHDTLPSRAQEWGILDDDLCDDLSRLRDLRVKADYYEDMIEYDEASDAQVMAQRLVAEVLERKAS
ncbi:MAG TPA: hypothetical protein VNO30_07320 [Kofleriaceae bacterium]|nr:hypothetical protein [Kofleriaceae bacterium]